MGILDLLLQTDLQKLQSENKKEVEIKRLSDIIGEKFIVSCLPLTNEQIAHVSEVSKDNVDMKLNALFEACRVEGKKLNSDALISKFGVASSKELIGKLFLPGEVSHLYSIVNEISGYNKDAVKEVKKN